MSQATEIRPTVLLVGRGEPLDAGLRVALDRHGLFVEEGIGDLRNAVRMTAPDLIVLLGDAAKDGGRAALDTLAKDPSTAPVPVAVLGQADALDARVQAFRHGAVAVLPRLASVDAIAQRVAAIVREEKPADELGEATLDDLVQLVGKELRAGLLRVEPAQRQSKEGPPLHIVLGAGRPVAQVVEEFVRKLAPLVSRAEPLSYELHRGGGAVALFDGDADGSPDTEFLAGLRVLLVDTDPARADALAQELRRREAIVAVVDASGQGIERARALDPDVVLVDTLGIEGSGFDVVRQIRSDARLRWASLLVVPWDEVWPSLATMPDIAKLADRIRPLVIPDRMLRDRAENERAFETRLESTGPTRLIRALAGLPGPYHVSVRSPRAVVELDVAEGLVVGATGATAKGERLEGSRALAALLALGSGRARIEQRSHAATANIMSPVEQALVLADREAAPVPPSMPPPPSAPLPPKQAVTADSESSGPFRPMLPDPTRAQPKAGQVAAKDLRWSDSLTDDASWGKDGPTKEVDVPAVPPGVAKPPSKVKSPSATGHLPSGIASRADADLSVVGPLPRGVLGAPSGPAAAARRTAFSVSSERSPKGTPPVPFPRHLFAKGSADDDAKPTTPRMAKVDGGPLPPSPANAGAEASRPGFPRPATAVSAHGSAPGTLLSPKKDAPNKDAAKTDAHSSVSVGRPVLVGEAREEPTDPTSTASKPSTASAPAGVKPPLAATKPGRTLVFGSGTPADGVEGAHDPTHRLPRRRETIQGLPGDPRIPSLPTHGDAEVEASADATQRNEPLSLEAADAALDAALDGDALDGDALASDELRSSELAEAESEDELGRLARSQPSPPLETPVGAPLGLPPPPRVPREGREPTGERPLPPPPSPPPPAPASPTGLPSVPADAFAAPEPEAPAAPAKRRSGARVGGLLLVGLGGLTLLGVLGYSQRDRLFGPAGTIHTTSLATPPEPTPTTPPEPTPPEPTPTTTPVATPTTPEPTPTTPEAPPEAPEPTPTTTPEATPPEATPTTPEPTPPEATPEVTPTAPTAGVADTPEALLRAAEAASDDAAREPLYRRALELDDRNHYAMIGLAEVLLRRGQPSAAIPLIQSAIRRRGRRAEFRVLLGDAYQRAGNADAARAAWREALAIDPSDRDAHARLGE